MVFHAIEQGRRVAHIDTGQRASAFSTFRQGDCGALGGVRRTTQHEM